MQTLIRNLLINVIENLINSNPVYSLYAISILLWQGVRNLEVKDGVEFITSMMEIWQFAQMSFITIWVSMMLCHGMIWNISLVKLCMEGTLQMTGIGELMQLIWKFYSKQPYCYQTSHYFITYSNLLIQLNLTMKDIENILNKNYLQKYHKCSECIQMHK